MLLFYWLPTTVLPTLAMLPLVSLTGVIRTSSVRGSTCTFASDLE